MEERKFLLLKTCKVFLTVLLINLSSTKLEVSANGAGAPNYACEKMRPCHGHDVTSLEPSSFTIDVSHKVITPNAKITVTLKAKAGKSFKGFLVTAYKTTGHGKMVNNLVGTFHGPENTRSTCHGKGLTHRDSQAKNSMIFTWTPPVWLSNSDKLVFQVTFVENYNHYWADHTSAQLTVSSFPATAPAVVVVDNKAKAKQKQVVPHSFLKEDIKCGVDYSCFHDCVGGNCSFTVSWKDKGIYVAFHMKMMPVAIRERWIAVGFSHDRKMGDDSVTECMVDSMGTVKVYNSYNNGKTNHRLDNKNVGLSNRKGTFVNGLLECWFHRNKTSNYEPKLFDLDKDWYIMFSDGEALGGDKLAHGFEKLPPVTNKQVNLESLVSIGVSSPVSSLVKAHGCLMTIAWMLLTSVGITTARYGKPLWPTYTLFGLKIWFQIHRTAMVTTMGLTIFSFLLILIEVKGISSIPEVTGKQYRQLHPWFGFMIIVLSLANPIMALFRPGAGAPGRIVFNWLHWAVAVISVFLAVITIFIGLDLPSAGVSGSAKTLMAFSVVYLVTAFLVMESIPCILRRLGVKKMYQLNPRNSTYSLTRQDSQMSSVIDDPLPSPNKEKEIKVKTWALVCHYIITTIFSLALMILVAQ